ncbi:MAG: ATP-binding protein [Lachnospiraceae bacterium]|nr:ATP-binding protein [Lachnospiraceae bacterium]
MVLGRTSELKYLNTCYDREGSQIMVVYGEKNVGKTALLDEFVQDKPHSYYCARPASEREQRYRWGLELKPEAFGAPGYPVFGEILRSALGEETDKKVIIVDEFQYIVKAGNEFMDELIAFVHDSWQGTQVMVVLCSSSIGWVENSMITRIGEAAYEISGFLKIKELSFETMMEYFPGFSMEQCIEAYAVLGGIPGLWAHFNDKISVRENICRYILGKNAFLNREGQRIMEEELRETGVYNTILASIAAGKHKLNELYLHTDFSRAKISVYLKNLMELELVEKIFSYDTEGKANTQKGIYRIKNHFVHFYFTYLYPNLSSLEQLAPDQFYKRYIAPYFKSYVAEYFKTVCRQHVEKLDKWGRLPVEIDRMGEWVGKLGTIDVIAQSEEGVTLIGICNWEKNIMSYADYEWLLFCAEKAKLRADYIYLFSVKHFDEKLNLEAKMKQNLKLISMNEM